MCAVKTTINGRVEQARGGGIRGLLWNAERMLAALLVNLQSMTAKPRAGGDSENCVAWQIEKVVH